MLQTFNISDLLKHDIVISQYIISFCFTNIVVSKNYIRTTFFLNVLSGDLHLVMCLVMSLLESPAHVLEISSTIENRGQALDLAFSGEDIWF